MKPGQPHPRNRYQGRYDLRSLLETSPELSRFAQANRAGEPSIDFANPEAVQALNRALLERYYGLRDWSVPPGYLCPPIPSRADYLHHLADLLAVNWRANGRIARGGDEVPRGPEVRGLDVGAGANCIYPILGTCEYGWRFVGAEIDETALANAGRILEANPKLRDSIELRRQEDPEKHFEGVLLAGERFEFTICNPPFHGSADEAEEVNRRKWRNLGRAPVSNFGGRHHELWTPGGEVAFISRMIAESARFADRVLWFTSLVSKETSLPALYRAISEAGALEYRVIDIHSGRKKSRILAWTFLGGKSSWPAPSVTDTMKS